MLVSLFGECLECSLIKVKRVVKIIFYYLKKGEEEKGDCRNRQPSEFSREGEWRMGREARKKCDVKSLLFFFFFLV